MKLALSICVALPLAAQSLPPKSTPGAINPAVTQSNIKSTICVPNWTKTVRPPARLTDKLKVQQMKELGLKGKPGDFEEDHREPLSSGGAPQDPKNLSPEPWTGPYNAHDKDRLEDAVHRDICSGKLTLAQGQAIFLGDFWKEYKRRFEGK